MPVTVKIPTQLRALTANEAEAQVEGSSVGEALEAVYQRYDGLRERITENGEVYNPLFRFVSRFVMGHTRTIDTYLGDVARHFDSAKDPKLPR